MCSAICGQYIFGDNEDRPVHALSSYLVCGAAPRSCLNQSSTPVVASAYRRRDGRLPASYRRHLCLTRSGSFNRLLDRTRFVLQLFSGLQTLGGLQQLATGGGVEVHVGG